MTRTLLPIGSTLTLFTTLVGCGGDPAIGDWNAASLMSGEQTTTFPNIGAYDYNGFYIEFDVDFTLSLDKEGACTLTRIAEVDVDGQRFAEASGSTSYMTTAAQVEKGTWSFAIPDFLDIDVTCTAEDDTLTCDGTDTSGDITFIWDRAPE